MDGYHLSRDAIERTKQIYAHTIKCSKNCVGMLGNHTQSSTKQFALDQYNILLPKFESYSIYKYRIIDKSVRRGRNRNIEYPMVPLYGRLSKTEIKFFEKVSEN